MKAAIFLFTIASATPATSEALCDGRYDAANEILDAAYASYGTLYSGGGHWQKRDSVGATLDVWRLLQGQDDLNLRRADAIDRDYSADPMQGGPSRHAIFMSYLPVLLANGAPELSEDDVYAIATSADLITTIGPEPDWWLVEEPPSLGEEDRQTRALAQTVPLVDWLQTTLAASNAPWAYGWHIPARLTSAERATYDAIARNARGQIRQGDLTEPSLAWTVAWAVATPNDTAGIADLAAPLGRAVTTCSATPAQYAAHAILRLEELRSGRDPRPDDALVLPSTFKRFAFESITRRTLGALPWDSAQAPFPEGLSHLRPDPRSDDNHLDAWFNVAQSYRAQTVAALIDIHAEAPLHPYTLRLLNVLSADDLRAFADAPGRLPEDRAALHTSVFLRLYGLHRDADAFAMLPMLAEIYPEQAPLISDVSGTLWPQDVKLAMIALSLPEASMWLRPAPRRGIWTEDYGLFRRNISAIGMDLPAEMRSGAFLQRDFETYLRLPSRWTDLRGMRGSGWPVLNRAHTRRIVVQTDPRVPHILVTGPTDRATGFHHLIAWDEITQLGPRTGAARRASETLVTWVDDRTDTWIERFFAPIEQMGRSMEQIIALARHNDIGELHGRPLARRAFEVLSYRLYDSSAAERVQYWHPCSRRCEN